MEPRVRLYTDGAAIMYKIIACLISFLLVATILFGLRRDRLNVTAESARVFHKIGQRRHILWDLQTRLSAQTNPIVLSRRIKELDAKAAAAAVTADASQSATVTPAPIGGTVPGGNSIP